MALGDALLAQATREKRLRAVLRDLIRFAERPTLVADERAEVNQIIEALSAVVADDVPPR